MKFLLALVATILIAGCAKPHTQAYFECAPNNTLVVCPIAETPDSPPHLECVAVGTGVTTLRTGTCS